MSYLPITTRREFFQALRGGPFTTVGSYPIFFFADGESYSFNAVKENCLEIGRQFNKKNLTNYYAEYKIQGVSINYESELYCDITSEPIESAYEIH